MGDFKPSLAASSEASQASTPVPVVQRRQGALKYYGNFSVAASRPDECSTAYSPTLTRSCATTLIPVGGPPIAITACDQEVTFSTDHGYRLAPTSTGGGSSDVGGEIETLTTFYVADWTDVATGLPKGLVKEEVCSKAGCTTRLERWIPVTTETLQTLTSTVQFTGVLSTVLAGSVTLTSFPNQDQPSSISLSTVIEITQTVPRTEISISTVSQPAATSSASNTYGIGTDDDDDDDDYTSTTTSTSTLTSYRTIQSASNEKHPAMPAFRESQMAPAMPAVPGPQMAPNGKAIYDPNCPDPQPFQPPIPAMSDFTPTVASPPTYDPNNGANYGGNGGNVAGAAIWTAPGTTVVYDQ
ncbi:MAG: hypothetical protein Q9212_004914 [Teloschistes hypoglaucus]